MVREVTTGGERRGQPDSVNMRTQEEIYRQFDPLGTVCVSVGAEDFEGRLFVLL